MTALVPRPPYSMDELNILYPKLQIVRGPMYGEVVVLLKKNLEHPGRALLVSKARSA